MTETQQKWAENLRNDFEDLPIGMAEGLVKLYLTKPEFFTEENLEKLKNEPPPDLEKGIGDVYLAGPEEVAEIERKIKESLPQAQLESETLSDKSSGSQ